MHRRFFFLVVTPFLLFSMPVAAQSDKELSETPVSATDTNAWVNREWVLTRFVYKGHARRLPDEAITLRFMPNFRVAGKAPVNRFFGGYQLSEPGLLKWSGPLGSTKMAGPPEATKLETEFFEALGKATRLAQGRQKLVFRDDKKEMTLEWSRAEEKGESDSGE